MKKKKSRIGRIRDKCWHIATPITYCPNEKDCDLWGRWIKLDKDGFIIGIIKNIEKK